MSFESGSISYRTFYLSSPLPTDFVERFARHAVPPIETMGTGEISGWVTGRHLLDRHITEESAMVAGYLRLTLMKAERIIPPALLRAECKMEELAEMQARGLPFLKRNERSAIKKEVTARLLPTMPPTLTGIDIACEPQGQYLYATATTDKQLDALRLNFRHTTGLDLVPFDPENVAAKTLKTDIRDLPPSSFSPELEDDMAEPHIGRDFLTWLWYYSEACGGIATLDVGPFAVAIEGPLCFMFEGAGAHETVLRNGQPLVSAEARTALLSGKKLKRAKVMFARDDTTWKFTFDADSFTFRSTQLPQGEELDAISRFQDRMLALDTLREVVTGYYTRFLEERLNRDEWKAIREDIRKWVGNRRSKA
jgi:hypothetical protein